MQSELVSFKDNNMHPARRSPAVTSFCSDDFRYVAAIVPVCLTLPPCHLQAENCHVFGSHGRLCEHAFVRATVDHVRGDDVSACYHDVFAWSQCSERLTDMVIVITAEKRFAAPAPVNEGLIFRRSNLSLTHRLRHTHAIPVGMAREGAAMALFQSFCIRRNLTSQLFSLTGSQRVDCCYRVGFPSFLSLAL